MKVSNHPLSVSDLRSAAPAIFGHQSSTVSDQYEFIPTSNLIDFAGDLGFLPVQVGQTRSKNLERRDSHKHFIRFRHENDFDEPEAVDLLLHNAHNGLSALKLQLGIFRMVCSNGLVVGDIVGKEAIRHVNVNRDSVTGAIEHLFTQKDHVKARIDVMKSTPFDTGLAGHLVNEAIKLRVGADVIEENPKALDWIRKHYAVRVRRSADADTNFWSLYNVLQENLQLKFSYYDADFKPRVYKQVRNASVSFKFSEGLDDLFTDNIPELIKLAA